MKIKKDTILLEDCGCKYRVLKVNKKSYKVQHVSDKDIFNWDKKDLEKHFKKHMKIL
jgi:hypothetical protein